MAKPKIRLPDSTSPGVALRAVTPHATDFLASEPCRALWVGVIGDVSVIAMQDDTAVVLKGVQGLLPIAVRAVRVTGTTATSIVAIY